MYKSPYESDFLFSISLRFKMNALKKLSAVNSKPYRGFTKLNVGYHSIEVFRTVKNKYPKKGETGIKNTKSILIELKNQVLFLPSYFWNTLNEDDLEELNKRIQDKGKVYLFFGGRDDDTK